MKTVEMDKGLSIYLAAEQAVSVAKKTKQDVKFIFNDEWIIASPFSFADDLAAIYQLKCQITRLIARRG